MFGFRKSADYLWSVLTSLTLSHDMLYGLQLLSSYVVGLQQLNIMEIIVYTSQSRRGGDSLTLCP